MGELLPGLTAGPVFLILLALIVLGRDGLSGTIRGSVFVSVSRNITAWMSNYLV